MDKLWILYDDRIDVSEGIDISKTRASEEWDLPLLVFFL